MNTSTNKFKSKLSSPKAVLSEQERSFFKSRAAPPHPSAPPQPKRLKPSTSPPHHHLTIAKAPVLQSAKRAEQRSQFQKQSEQRRLEKDTHLYKNIERREAELEKYIRDMRRGKLVFHAKPINAILESTEESDGESTVGSKFQRVEEEDRKIALVAQKKTQEIPPSSLMPSGTTKTRTRGKGKSLCSNLRKSSDASSVGSASVARRRRQRQQKLKNAANALARERTSKRDRLGTSSSSAVAGYAAPTASSTMMDTNTMNGTVPVPPPQQQQQQQQQPQPPQHQLQQLQPQQHQLQQLQRPQSQQPPASSSSDAGVKMMQAIEEERQRGQLRKHLEEKERELERRIYELQLNMGGVHLFE
mmetsp:Transcript_18008/g.26742  ORF Transcript_18008/g.26742 Transcript_18008/m.26742 type:complete len:359 (-) Transcript_18008:901-1977(-)